MQTLDRSSTFFNPSSSLETKRTVNTKRKGKKKKKKKKEKGGGRAKNRARREGKKVEGRAGRRAEGEDTRWKNAYTRGVWSLLCSVSGCL